MKNFKQLAFGLMVAILAIGFSAFTSASKFATTFYTLNQAGTVYTNAGTSDPSGLCNPKATNPDCTISYASDKGTTLNPASLPPGHTSVSGPGWINP